MAESKTLRGGLRLDDETVGSGALARRGDTVTVRYELSLRRGEVVQTMPEYTFVLGRRTVVAALEYGVEGMRVGGRRRFRAGPHLAYRDEGIPGLVPPNALLTFDVRLICVEQSP